MSDNRAIRLALGIARRHRQYGGTEAVPPVRTERNPEGGYSPVGDVPLDAPAPLREAYRYIAPDRKSTRLNSSHRT